MCGIAGFIRLGGDDSADAGALSPMLDVMVHRGPDGNGQWRDDAVHLGHCRLAIIDVDNGAQPMVGQSGCVIVFNGEIYNYRELRDDLERQGETFATGSDTEVLLRLYEREGAACLQKLVGMFAFAVWDPRTGTLFLARDRLGKKPLYIYNANGVFAFASEVKALMSHPAIGGDLDIDVRSLADVLALGYILSPKSMFTAITQLPAAHHMTFTPSTGEAGVPQCYWDLAAFFRSPKQSAGQGTYDRFRQLLKDAVTIRMRSDVPLGVFLSGGIDSGAVAACMAETGENVGAYNISFAEESFDESIDAKASADALKIDFTTKQLPLYGREDVERIFWYCDAPFADTSIVPTYLLSKEARKAITVALSGDGADELLAGYPTYKADIYHRYWRKVPGFVNALAAWVVDKAFKPSYRKLGLDYKIKKFLAGHGLSAQKAHYFWREIFSAEERDKILTAQARERLGDYDPFDAFAKHFKDVEGCGFLDQSLYVDIKTWLVDDILVKADRMSMANSLELRSPFLDHRVVEFCATLPDDMKMGARGQKHILRAIMADILPAQVIDGKKRGFGAPTRHFQFNTLDVSGFEGLLNSDLVLDPDREDITYKSFIYGGLGNWLRFFTDFKKRNLSRV